MFKFLFLLTIAVSSVVSYDVPAITTQHQNVLRSYGNLGPTYSAYSKTLDTPFSTVRKADVRISNPGLTIASPYGHYGQAVGVPALGHSVYPALGHSVGLPNLGHSIGLSAFGHPVGLPSYGHAVGLPSYGHPVGLPGLGQPVLHGAYPAISHGPLIAPAVAKTIVPGALGVAYSPSTAVSHMSYTNGLGLSYAW